MDSRLVFEVGCALCLQITVVILATFLLQRWVADARSQCRLWTICFVGVIVLVATAFLLPHRRLLHFPGGFSRETMLGVVVWQTRFSIVLASVWMIGATRSILRRVILCFEVLRFLKMHCEPIDAVELLARANVTSHDDDKLSILTSDKIQGPFCWQLHQPVIVLPSFLLSDDELTLRHVLLHEIEHLRTQHPMQHFLQGVCSTLFWFHPLVWMAADRAELTREYLCDEVAAKTAGKFSAYLRTLAKVAERCSGVSCTNAPEGTLAFGNQPSALIRRSNRLVKLAESEKPQSRWRPIAAMAGLLLCTAIMQQIWLPTNAMASQRSDWSPWPTWTAGVLHQANLHVRDFEMFEDGVHMHELLYEDI
ncbi:Regulatory protein BlaR1 [Novipirellula aureliae]|uniref:Regulatory protein BlaR1 n=1 Tax=Novipirellula aureliae TaxID=2527966 RepID=A0A5C6DFV9_9BACT|nr:M56 family metallopeptidase [Novipirellula aureliae]TWU35670.1 Regulatory protein BlaR1 [Novipirellula aureliae]